MKSGLYGMIEKWIPSNSLFRKCEKMDPPWALGNKLGDHSNFIALFQTLTYIKPKKPIDYFQSTMAHSQNTRTHFGPKITFLAIIAFNICFFGILSTGKYQAIIVTYYHADIQDISAILELYLL